MSVNYVNFLRREFYEISGASALYVPRTMRLMATIRANARDHTRVRTAASVRMLDSNQ